MKKRPSNLFFSVGILGMVVLVLLAYLNGFQTMVLDLFSKGRIYELKELEERDVNIGHLYKIIDKKSSEKYLAVADTKVPEGSFNTKDFNFEYLDTSHIWNPKSCAKMPSVIDSSGNLYMIDVVYEEGKFVKKFIIYDFLTKEKRYFDLGSLLILSDLFIEEDSVFFFVRQSDGVYKYVLESVGIDAKFITDNIFKIRNDDLITAKKNVEDEIIFSWFKNLTKKELFSYNLDKNILTPIVSDEKDLVEISMLDKRKFDNGKFEWRDLENELDYGVYYDSNKSIQRFLKPGVQIYMYTINSF